MPLRFLLLLLCLATSAAPALAQFLPAQTPAAAAPPADVPKPPEPAPPPMRIIIEVPNDATGRAFVSEQIAPKFGMGSAAPGNPAGAAPAAPSVQPMASPVADMSAEMSMMAAEDLAALRTRAEALASAVPTVPGALGRLTERFGREGEIRPMALLAAFAFFSLGGFAARNAAFWSARGLLARILEMPGETAQQRLKLLGMRVSFSIYVLGAAVMGSLGAFLLFPWPPLFREMVLIMLGAFVVRARPLHRPGGDRSGCSP